MIGDLEDSPLKKYSFPSRMDLDFWYYLLYRFKFVSEPPKAAEFQSSRLSHG
jgi:hypothetical protein